MSLPGGSDVGTAYIRILADGGNFDEDLRRQFNRRDRDRIFADQGRRSGKAYSDEFNESLRRHVYNDNKLRSSLARQRARFNAEGSKLGGQMGDAIEAALRTHLGDEKNGAIAKQIRRNLTRMFNEGLIDEAGVHRKLEHDFVRLRVQAIRDIEKIETQSRKRRLDADTKLQQALFREFENLEKHRAKLLDEHDIKESQRERLIRRKAITGGVISAVTNRDFKRIDELRTKMEHFNTNAERGFIRSTGLLRQDVRQLSEGERKAVKFGEAIDRLAHAAGRASGKGSRNNFFNALGSSVEGLLKLAFGGIPKASRLLREFGGEFRHAAESGATFGEKFKNVADVALQNVVQVMGSVIGAAGGLAAALGGLVAIGGILIPIIVALAGAVVGLAGTLAFALAGAIGTLLPVVLALAAGIGVVAIAFAGMRKASKEAKAQLRADLAPITSQFAGLRRVVQHNLFSQLGLDAKLLAPVLRSSVIPLVGKIATAMAGVGTSFARVIASPGFRLFLNSMQTFLPRAIRYLGIIFSKVFLGMAGIFRALAPFALKFLRTIAGLADKFGAWANSVKGQNRIAKFMHDAGDAAFAAWQFIKSLFKVTGDLLSAGRGAPRHGFLDSITDSLNRMSDFLRSPKGQKGLHDFFEETRKVFSGLGKVANGIAALFLALNSKAGQKILQGVLAGLAVGFKILAAAIPIFNATIGALFRFLAAHTWIVVALASAFVSVKLAMIGVTLVRGFNAIFGAGGALGTFARNAGLSAGAIRGIGVAMQGVAVIAAAGLVGSSIHSKGSGGWLESILGGAAAGGVLASIGGPLGVLAGAGLGALAGAIGHGITLWSDHKKAAKKALDAEKAAVESVTAALLANNGALDANLRSSVVSGLQKSGTISDAQLLISAGSGIPGFNLELKDLTDAALGSQEAIAKIKTAFDLFDSRPDLFNPTTEGGKKLLAALGRVEPALGLVAKTTLEGARNAVQHSIATGKMLSGFLSIKQEIANNGLDLEKNNAASVLNANYIKERTDLLGQQAVKYIQHGHTVAEATAHFQANTRSLRANLVAAGFNANAVDTLLASIKKLPKSATVKIEALVAAAKVKVADIKGRISTLKGKLLTIDTSTEAGKAKAQAIKDLIAKLKNKAIDLLVRSGASPTVIAQLRTDLATLPTSKTIDIYVNRRGSSLAIKAGAVLYAAAGRVLSSPTMIRSDVLAGEAGREAVVPLDRPLSQIDPSVRWMAALIRGDAAKRLAGGGVAGSGRTVHVGGITLVTPTTDPAAVATELLNKLVASAY